MKQKKRIVTAVVTVGAIVGASQLMQLSGGLSALNSEPPATNAAGFVTTPAPEPTEIAEAPEAEADAAPVETVEAPAPVEETVEIAEGPEADAPLPDPAIVTDAVRPDPVKPDVAEVESASAPLTAEVEEPAVVLEEDVAEVVETPVAPVETTEVPEVTAPDPSSETEATSEITLAALDEDKAPVPPATPMEIPEMPSDMAAPEPLPLPERVPPGNVAESEPDMPDAVAEEPARNEFGLACDVVLSAAEQRSAMVKLTLTAPCRGDERITVRHAGMVFSDTIDGLGSYSVRIPALEADAEFKVTFADGSAAETSLTVPMADTAERVVLQYNGKTGLQIHALEFGADYGESGHVWAGNTRDADLAMKAGGGYLSVLGDPALPDAFMAQVYTLPADASARDGVVRLNVEAEVTEANCGHDVAGQTIQRQPDGEMRAVSLTLSMPGCDAVGEFLVLKNLLRDLKIASN